MKLLSRKFLCGCDRRLNAFIPTDVFIRHCPQLVTCNICLRQTVSFSRVGTTIILTEPGLNKYISSFSLPPSWDRENLQKLPQLAAIHHNNCMYIAHHLLTLGHQFRYRLTNILCDGAATFVDLVPGFRRLGNFTFQYWNILMDDTVLILAFVAEWFNVSVATDSSSGLLFKSFGQVARTFCRLGSLTERYNSKQDGSLGLDSWKPNSSCPAHSSKNSSLSSKMLWHSDILGSASQSFDIFFSLFYGNKFWNQFAWA